MSTQLCGAIKHELNQPLTVILGRVQLMKRQGFAMPGIAMILPLLEEQAGRMKTFIHKISRMRDYVTMPYAEGHHIIDIDRASQASSDNTAHGPRIDAG